MTVEFEYKVIQASWGIRVRLSAEVRAEPVSGAISWGPLHFVPGNLVTKVAHAERASIRYGLSLAASLLAVSEDVSFLCDDIQLNPTDYQPEGMTCAVLGMVLRYFGRELPSIPVSFDAERGRYDFDFSGLLVSRDEAGPPR